MITLMSNIAIQITILVHVDQRPSWLMFAHMDVTTSGSNQLTLPHVNLAAYGT